jgi:hypothetical protein
MREFGITREDAIEREATLRGITLRGREQGVTTNFPVPSQPPAGAHSRSHSLVAFEAQTATNTPAPTQAAQTTPATAQAYIDAVNRTISNIGREYGAGSQAAIIVNDYGNYLRRFAGNENAQPMNLNTWMRAQGRSPLNRDNPIPQALQNNLNSAWNTAFAAQAGGINFNIDRQGHLIPAPTQAAPTAPAAAPVQADAPRTPPATGTTPPSAREPQQPRTPATNGMTDPDEIDLVELVVQRVTAESAGRPAAEVRAAVDTAVATVRADIEANRAMTMDGGHSFVVGELQREQGLKAARVGTAGTGAGAAAAAEPQGPNYRAVGSAVRTAISTINGSATGLNEGADFERILMSAVGSTALAGSATNTATPNAGETNVVMRISGATAAQLATFAEQLNSTYQATGENRVTSTATTVTIPMALMTEFIIPGREAAGGQPGIPSLVEQFARVGRDHPEVIRDVQTRADRAHRPGTYQSPAERAAAAVQTGTTTPAAPVVPGTVVVGHGSQFALRVGQNNEATIRGSMDYNIVAGENGTRRAQVMMNGQAVTLVNQEITATLDGVNGAPARHGVRLRADNVGNLTEVRAQQSPQGNSQSTQSQR